MTNKNFKNNQENFTSSVKISDEGAEFRDPFDGKKYFLTPEKAIEIQLKLGSDIMMVLDECPPYPCTRQQAEKAVERTTVWARRCKRYFIKKFPISNFQFPIKSQIPNSKPKIIKRPLLFGITQGSVYQDLRERSAREMVEIGFDGYAIGGVAVGEPRQYLAKVLKWALPLLPEDKPRYLMGLGRPEEIVMAVELGIDLFDCVIPTREARHGRLYKFKNQKSIRQLADKITRQNSKFYETINILNSKYRSDVSFVNESNLRNYNLAYLHHLFRLNEPLAMRLATLNNLNFYLSLITKISQMIKKGDK
jgi:queuine tRNA-ribosyltransferase